MNGGETNADRANADDPTAWRPPIDALSAILQKSSGGNSATGFGDPEIQLSPFSWAMMPRAGDAHSDKIGPPFYSLDGTGAGAMLGVKRTRRP